jgi:hypothetical protein
VFSALDRRSVVQKGVLSELGQATDKESGFSLSVATQPLKASGAFVYAAKSINIGIFAQVR